ncbi:MAG: CapA family protein [Clostridia bacterium]|nr:CapA family protein [Clostridia bacterium]
MKVNLLNKVKKVKWWFWGLIGAVIIGALYLASTNFSSWNISNSSITKKDASISSEPVHIVSNINIGSMGDLLIHAPMLVASFDKNTKQYNFEKIFTYIKPYIEDLDYAVINLEGTLAKDNYSGYPTFKYPDNIIDCAKNCGFNMFLTANNHSNDGGPSGFARTADILKQKGVDFTGTRVNKEDAKYVIKDIKGIKIGVVNYTYGEISENGTASVNGIPSSRENSKLFNVFDYKKLEDFYNEQADIIAEMREIGVDKILYYMHWGEEYQLKPNDSQQKIAQKLCDLGVDVIIGGHPHVIQPMDIIHSDVSDKDTVCIYSLGNAVSNQRKERKGIINSGHTEDGVIFTVSFTKYSDGTVLTSGVKILPTWVNLYTGEAGEKVYQIVPLDKSKDWNTLNLKNNLENASASYQRTMWLLEPGFKKANDLISKRLEIYPD